MIEGNDSSIREGRPQEFSGVGTEHSKEKGESKGGGTLGDLKAH